jgi:hypothetical protein
MKLPVTALFHDFGQFECYFYGNLGNVHKFVMLHLFEGCSQNSVIHETTRISSGSQGQSVFSSVFTKLFLFHFQHSNPLDIVVYYVSKHKMLWVWYEQSSYMRGNRKGDLEWET